MSDKTLAEMRNEFYKTLSNEDRSKHLVNKLYDVEKELEMTAAYAKSETWKELALWQRDVVGDSRKLIEVLAREQWRQREAIKLFLHGQVDRHFLRNVSETWNGEGAKSD